MLQFLQELRKVSSRSVGGCLGASIVDPEAKSEEVGCTIIGQRSSPSSPLPPPPPPPSLLTPAQHVTVGIVGGSDLVKIQEQLGSNSERNSRFLDARRRGGAATERSSSASARAPFAPNDAFRFRVGPVPFTLLMRGAARMGAFDR